MRRTWMLIGLAAAGLSVRAFGQDHVGHERHRHSHNAKHATVQDATRFVTNRSSTLDLPLPSEEDAFFFVVFGDRTGGPAEGVSVLADAVRDANLLEPDLVMTVGDLIEGYNRTDEWMAQMREYKGVMDELLCPWFPVAGNHDVYWRGEDRPPQEHESHYEMHFGPLWYAFEHKDCWFIALYTDEGNPETTERNFQKPECQRMSEEQFAWLDETLSRASGAKHVFLFAHHPRWLGGQYGDDWNRVHERLVQAGNVTAVFAGHIHRMRSDPRDGIEYVTLATVGGHQNGTVPATGWLHEFHIVTVREGQVALSAIPVGEVMDVREITGELADEAATLAVTHPQVLPALPMGEDGVVSGEVSVLVRNPVSRGIDVTLTADSGDSRWGVEPDHRHLHLDPGSSREVRFHVMRAGGNSGGGLDSTYRGLSLLMDVDLIGKGFRYPIPTASLDVVVDPALRAPATRDVETALRLDGTTGYARVAGVKASMPDGPMTLECWFNASRFESRTALVCKTEDSEFGLFAGDGKPSFWIHLDGRYVGVTSPEAVSTNEWHHVAGVYDGSEVRVYVDGLLMAKSPGKGQRRTNGLPLLIGADVTGSGGASDWFNGMLDGVRLSTVARYDGPFTAQRRLGADDSTALLLNMDGAVAVWLYDESSRASHPMLEGDAAVVSAP